MRSGGYDINYFKLTKLTNFVQFKCMFMFCLEDWWGLGPLPPWLRYCFVNVCNIHCTLLSSQL